VGKTIVPKGYAATGDHGAFPASNARNTIEALRAAYAAPILVMPARPRRGVGGSSAPAERLQVGKVLPKPFMRELVLRAVRDCLKRS